MYGLFFVFFIIIKNLRRGKKNEIKNPTFFRTKCSDLGNGSTYIPRLGNSTIFFFFFFVTRLSQIYTLL